MMSRSVAREGLLESQAVVRVKTRIMSKKTAANATSACLFHLPPVLDGDENTGPRRCLPCVVLDKIKSKSPIVLLERTTHDAYRLSPGVSRPLPESPGGGRAFETRCGAPRRVPLRRRVRRGKGRFLQREPRQIRQGLQLQQRAHRGLFLR